MMRRLFKKHPAIPFVAPFLAYIALLAAGGLFKERPTGEYAARLILVSLVLIVASRQVLSLRASKPLSSILVGLTVFAIWIAPDVLWPSYRQSGLFNNPILGKPESSIPISARSNVLFLALRLIGTAVIVPIVEELFWRAWLMRYLIDANFTDVGLGTYSTSSFWLTAVLFASEHGPFWEVGLVAGIVYNWWMIRTKSVGDCILAHAVTNTALAAYVIGFHQWSYWL